MWPKVHRKLSQLHSAEIRHREIGHQQIDATGSAEDFHGILRAGGLDRTIAKLADDDGANTAHVLVIVNHEDHGSAVFAGVHDLVTPN